VKDLKHRLELQKREQTETKEKPRWFRLNNLRLLVESAERSLDPAEILSGQFQNYRIVKNLSALSTDKFYQDANVPGLFAAAPGVDLTHTKAYDSGKVILQDKASCFPAHLLLDRSEVVKSLSHVGDIIDACAAPGNKTTHLVSELFAMMGKAEANKHRIFACERDPGRSKILQSMVSKAGARNVEALAKTDFLSLDPKDAKFRRVSHLLLDPSCSGSGIVGREDIPVLDLPGSAERGTANKTYKGKKRKLDDLGDGSAPEATVTSEGTKSIQTRLEKLSNLQSRIIEHAFSFPYARRISYSTCSIHTEENEAVVSRVLQSSIAKKRGWRLLPRKSQPAGIQSWQHRGVQIPTMGSGSGVSPLTDEQLDACVRCYPGDEEGTMGFFVCCFVRDAVDDVGMSEAQSEDEDEFSGFSD
jgi:25S rRNA (cytosine2278-C5)-methyltransferase